MLGQHAVGSVLVAYGDAAFVNYAPKLWNPLPKNIREANVARYFQKAA